MSVAYGLPVSDAQHEVRKNWSSTLIDPTYSYYYLFSKKKYITHAEATMEMINQVTMPGAFIADIIPICKKKKS